MLTNRPVTKRQISFGRRLTSPPLAPPPPPSPLPPGPTTLPSPPTQLPCLLPALSPVSPALFFTKQKGSKLVQCSSTAAHTGAVSDCMTRSIVSPWRPARGQPQEPGVPEPRDCHEQGQRPWGVAVGLVAPTVSCYVMEQPSGCVHETIQSVCLTDTAVA